VTNANSDAIIVFVEGVNEDSEAWAMTHPAVDLISTSYGIPGSPPLPYHVEKGFTGVVGNGKLHFGAADNSPAVSLTDTTSGPWWTISIAGFAEDGSEGREYLSGTYPDFVADFTQSLPYCHDCESGGEEDVSGTSFATPRSAGTMSKIILTARQKAGHVGGIVTEGVAEPLMVRSRRASGAPTNRGISNWQFRRALEEAAYYPSAEEYEADPFTYPFPPEAPWTVASWGAITPDPEHRIVEEALAQLGVRGFGEPTRHKDAGACTFMIANIEARMAYWNTNLGSESFGTTQDPYIRC